MALQLKNVMIRSASGLVYIGLVIGGILCGRIGVGILASLLAILGCCELESKGMAKEAKGNRSTLILTDCIMLLMLILAGANAFANPQLCNLFLLILVFVMGFRMVLQIFIPQKQPLFSVATSFFSLLYIGLPLVILECLCTLSWSPWYPICIIAMIWINDTGAFLVGCMFGRHKMHPRISPQKSWEGLFGGILFNVGAAFIYYYCFHLLLPLYPGGPIAWIIIGLTVSLFSTLGDLFESMLKRSLSVKDFGNIMPGHGGILDRIDSLLFVMPGVALILFLLFDFSSFV